MGEIVSTMKPLLTMVNSCSYSSYMIHKSVVCSSICPTALQFFVA